MHLGSFQHALAVILVFLSPGLSICLQEAIALEFDVRRIAHAGGGIDGATYTNSYNALEANLQRGFRYFEIDFSFTSDGHLVCLHDWEGSFTRSFGLPSEGAVDILEFQRLVRERSRYKKCTLLGLAAWLTINPNAVIVTDLKERNIEGLKLIAETVPDYVRRVIPQVYNPNEFLRVREMGYRRVIWTLYNYSGADKDILSHIRDMSAPLAIAMPLFKTKNGLSLEIRRLGIPVYVHTINEIGTFQSLVEEFDVSEIYTDFLAPD